MSETSPRLRSSQESESKPVRLLWSIAGGAAVLAGGLPTLTPDKYDWIGGAIGLAGLVIAGALGRWTQNQVTPWEDVAAKTTPSGKVIAGPAASQPTGATVAVVDDTPPSSFQPGASVYPGDGEGDPL